MMMISSGTYPSNTCEQLIRHKQKTEIKKKKGFRTSTLQVHREDRQEASRHVVILKSSCVSTQRERTVWQSRDNTSLQTNGRQILSLGLNRSSDDEDKVQTQIFKWDISAHRCIVLPQSSRNKGGSCYKQEADNVLWNMRRYCWAEGGSRAIPDTESTAHRRPTR